MSRRLKKRSKRGRGSVAQGGKSAAREGGS